MSRPLAHSAAAEMLKPQGYAVRPLPQEAKERFSMCMDCDEIDGVTLKKELTDEITRAEAAAKARAAEREARTREKAAAEAAKQQH